MGYIAMKMNAVKSLQAVKVCYTNLMIARQKFPKDFLWGASTASHQVEGGTINQWSAWELEHASELATTADTRLNWIPGWNDGNNNDKQDIKAQAETPENYVSGAGIDHYNRYEEDFDLLQKLQFNSFRFGIEWSRIQPEEGVFDKEAINHYHEYINSLNRRGVEPMLNLWHWTMPTWFTDKGGFEKKENLAFFDTFVTRMAEEYADKVKYVITLNEPNVYASFSYLNGDWPPQGKSAKTAFTVYHNLVKAHKRAYAILKARNSTLQIGVAAQLANIQAKRPHNIIDSITTKVMRYGWNWWFLTRIRKQQDFIGVNYYFTDYYRGFGKRDNPKVPTNDLGWYMEPEGLYPLMLRTWARYKKPLIITENGVADRNDDYREWWLEQTIIAMQRALSEGVELKGYMHWSLLDNFEWKYGWWPKFGLVEVDREQDMERKPRLSAIWFAKQLREFRDLSGVPMMVPAAKPVQSVQTVQPAQPSQPTQRVPSTQPVVKPKPASNISLESRPQQAAKNVKSNPQSAAHRIRTRKQP
jgi:beta-glucosidase